MALAPADRQRQSNPQRSRRSRHHNLARSANERGLRAGPATHLRLSLRDDVLVHDFTRAVLAHPATTVLTVVPPLLSATLDGFALATHARPLHAVAGIDLGVALVVTASVAIALVATAPADSVQAPRAERPIVLLRVVACVLSVVLLALAAWMRPAGSADPPPTLVLLAVLGGLGALLALRVTVVSPRA